MDKRKKSGFDHLSDSEDIPSDFFDDFNRDDFIDSLSVIDSWHDVDSIKRRSSRIDVEVLESVKDLRELIKDGKDADKDKKHKRRSKDVSYLDNFIKPGSRRDPNKTKEAIKKDKEVKVKEYLAKHLDSSEELRPPGTELDDFFDESKHGKKGKRFEETPPRPKDKHKEAGSSSRSYGNSHRSPHRSVRRSPRRSLRRSPRRSPRHSPLRSRYSPHHSHQSPFHSSRYSPRRSPLRRSPRRSPHHGHFERKRNNSRSPHYHHSPNRTHIRLSSSPIRPRYKRSPFDVDPKLNSSDTFLYPNIQPSNHPWENPAASGQQYSSNSAMEFSYPPAQNTPYSGDSGNIYRYEPETVMPGLQVPAPAIAPPLNPVASSVLSSPAFSTQPKLIHLPPQQITPTIPKESSTTAPHDALAQLVAAGKLSHEDYLKLAPNKGSSNLIDTKNRVAVLNRCHDALSKLSKLVLPNRLIMSNSIITQDTKSLLPKYCSPLKRQVAVEFHFTKPRDPVVQQNRQLVDRIICSVGLDKVVSRPKKKAPKNMKDAAVQTTKPFCDVCEIRDGTKTSEAGTYIDSGYFTSTVHTQVVEQDLASSKSVFNPSGSITDGAPVSIAHMTPAQLVSQLAARAKSLKQAEPVPDHSAYNRRNMPGDYERGMEQQYSRQYNYRF